MSNCHFAKYCRTSPKCRRWKYRSLTYVEISPKINVVLATETNDKFIKIDERIFVTFKDTSHPRFGLVFSSQVINALIIYMKKFLDSDWLSAITT